MQNENSLETLIDIMKKLRSPEGCPWDKEQTHDSIKKYIIEETYEFIEALEENDSEKMKDELGDLLFQIIFHCQMANEKELFSIYDVIKTSKEKMVRRHPHVFGSVKIEKSNEVIDQWEKIKKKEKNHLHRKSILDGVPIHLPSLIRAYKVQKKAAKVGFDWDKPEDIIDKIHEELEETKDALKNSTTDHLKEEIGDLFFAVANLARFLHFDPEELSRKSVDKFVNRFKKIEKTMDEQGKNFNDTSIEEMEEIWVRNKKLSS